MRGIYFWTYRSIIVDNSAQKGLAMLFSLGLWIGFQVSHSLFAGVIAGLLHIGFVVSFFKRDGIVVGTFFALVSGLFTWLAYSSMPIYLILCIDLILVPISLGCVVAAILFDSPA